MLEAIVKHVEMMPKDAVVEQIRRELIEAVLDKTMPKRWSSIEPRLKDLERCPEGRKFQFEVVNFILWINGMSGPGSTHVKVPEPKHYINPASFFHFLPYTRYTFKLADKALKIFPFDPRTGGQSITAATAEALVRQTPDKEYRKEFYINYENNHCQLMWINEDGLASVKSSRDGYEVKPLKSILERCSP